MNNLNRLIADLEYKLNRPRHKMFDDFIELQVEDIEEILEALHRLADLEK